MSRLTVQVAFGSTMASPMVEAGREDQINPTAYPSGVANWTDITQYVDIQTAGVRIGRGAKDELSEVQPGTATVTLDNEDGRFTPGNAASPYWPNVLKHVPIRATLTTLGGKNFVQTPSFESGSVRGWYRGNPTSAASYTTGTGQALHGTTSMAITWAASGAPGLITTDLYGLTVGATYAASAYVYVETGEPPVRLSIAGDATGTASTTAGAWERITVTWTATAAAHTLQVTPTGNGVTGPLTWLDAVQVEEGSSATSFDSNGAQIHPRGLWVVNEWPIRWEGLEAKTLITCTDLLKLLSQLPELQAMLVEEVLLRDPVAYYPLSEGSDSTSAGDLAGLGAASLSIQQAGSGGTLTFGQDGGPDDGLTVVSMAPSSATAGKYLLADLGGELAIQAATTGKLWIEAWFTTSTTDRVLVALDGANNRQQLIISLESGTGKVRIQASSTGASGLTGSTTTSPNLADGALHHIAYDQSGGVVWVDGANSYSAYALDLRELRNMTVGSWEGARLWSGTIAHVAVYSPASAAASWFYGHYTTGTTQHTGETADARMSRLAAYADITVETSGTTFDPVAAQAELGSTPLTHMREIETTEAGKLFASRGTNKLTFQSRSVRYNPVAAAALTYADLDTGSVEYADDDQKLMNIVEASRPGGATFRVVDSASVARYGRYQPSALTLYKTTDVAAESAAQWMLQRFADPPPELRQVPMEASTLGVTTYRALLGADISTALTVTSLPSQAPASSTTVTVEGYEETITEEQHVINFHTSRTDTDSVWVLDSSTYSVLDSTTRLAY